MLANSSGKILEFHSAKLTHKLMEMSGAPLTPSDRAPDSSHFNEPDYKKLGLSISHFILASFFNSRDCQCISQTINLNKLAGGAS